MTSDAKRRDTDPVPALDPSGEWLYWTGCAASFDPRVAAIVRAAVKVLRAGGIRLHFLGEDEVCTGDPARRLGEEGLFQQLALQNIDTLRRHGIRRIVTHCAHCFHMLENEYPRFGGEFDARWSPSPSSPPCPTPSFSMPRRPRST